ncbi:hypothetical protein FQA39_LY17159 [Lamprigera yunnana]|nr:hypothetical protein FQA39_LY17159 [Lamprigera yunnana]
MTTIRNINLGETYYFRIRVNTWGYNDPLSDFYTFKMVNRTRSCYDQQKMTKRFNTFRAAATSYSKVEVWWNLPIDSNDIKGFILFYGTSDLSYWYNKTVPADTNSIELTGLDQSTTYRITIATIKDTGLKHYPNEIQVTVIPEEVPLEIEISDVTADSMIVRWLPPLHLFPVKYKISYNGIKDFLDSEGIRKQYWLEANTVFVDSHLTSYELVDLFPFTQYYINISAVPFDHSYRPSIKVTEKTKIGPPGKMMQPTINGLVNGGNVQLLLPKASEENGPISYYYLVVVPEKNESNDLPSDAYTTEDLLDPQLLESEEIRDPYIAAKFPSKIPYAFILGVGIQGGFKNNKLDERRRYRVFVRAIAVTQHGQLYSDSPYSDYFSVKNEKTKYT